MLQESTMVGFLQRQLPWYPGWHNPQAVWVGKKKKGLPQPLFPSPCGSQNSPLHSGLWGSVPFRTRAEPHWVTLLGCMATRSWVLSYWSWVWEPAHLTEVMWSTPEPQTRDCWHHPWKLGVPTDLEAGKSGEEGGKFSIFLGVNQSSLKTPLKSKQKAESSLWVFNWTLNLGGKCTIRTVLWN